MKIIEKDSLQFYEILMPKFRAPRLMRQNPSLLLVFERTYLHLHVINGDLESDDKCQR